VALTGLIGAAAAGIVIGRLHRAAPVPPATMQQPARPANVTLTGRVLAQHVVPVAAPLEGVLDQVLVQVGQEVVAGQLLARVKSGALEGSRDAAQLDVERNQDKVNSLEARMTAARLEASRAGAVATSTRAIAEKTEREYLRQNHLNAEGATPRLTFQAAQRENERAQADWKAAQSVADQAGQTVEGLANEIRDQQKLLDQKSEALEQSKNQIAAGDVLAPVDGIVVGLHGEPGESVSPSTNNLVEIGTDAALLEVDAEAPPDVQKLVEPGMSATVQVLELGAEPIPANVKSVEPGKVVVTFVSPTPLMKPGLTAQVTIPIAGSNSMPPSRPNQLP